MHHRRHGEHLVQLLKGLPLGLRHEQQDKHKPHHIPPSIPAKRALWFERILQTGPRDRQHEVEKPRRCRRQRHAIRTHVERVCLGGIREGHGAFAGRVGDAEQVDTQRNAAGVGPAHGGGAVGGDPEREARKQLEDAHEREGDEEKVAAAEGVNRVDGGDGEEPVDHAEAEGSR